MSRIVVVGAGIGGLAAAARLAAAGHRVTVCEQAGTVGGKLGWYARDGFSFDTGPSLLTMPYVFEDLFAATGAPLREVLDVTRVEPIAHYRYADGTEFDAVTEPAAFAANLDAALGGGAGADWLAFLGRAERAWLASRGPFLENAQVGALRTVARAARHPRDIAALSPGRTLRGLGTATLRDPRLRMYLDRYATYTGSDPRRAPAALAVVPYAEQAFGAWYVPGGLRRLGLAIADRAVKLGAEIRTGADVVEVTLGSGGAVDGVLLADGSRLPADLVVANADAAHLYGDLLPAGRGPRRRAAPSLSGFVLLLAVRSGSGPAPAHHTVLFPADYDAEFDAVFGGRIAEDPTVYVSAPADPALAPPGHEAWFVLVNAPRHGADAAPADAPRHGAGGVDWDAPGRSAAYAERIIDLLGARGMPVRDRLLWYETRTPADLARRTRATGGAIYGTSSNGALAAFRRPANRSPVPGLFLVGGSAHPGGGLPLVTLSARIVADQIGPA